MEVGWVMSEKRKTLRAAFSFVPLFPVSSKRSLWNLDLEFFCLFFLLSSRFSVFYMCEVFLRGSDGLQASFLPYYLLRSLYLLRWPARPADKVSGLSVPRSF